MGVDVAEIPSVWELSHSSQKPVSSRPVARFIHTLSEHWKKNMKDTDTYSKLQHIDKERGALSTNSVKKYTGKRDDG